MSNEEYHRSEYFRKNVLNKNSKYFLIMDIKKRDPETDHLITPKNSVLVVLDYQPVNINAVTSIDRATLVANIVLVTKLAKYFDLPIIQSTINASKSDNNVIPALRTELYGFPHYDRTYMNAWEDDDFRNAVINTGRKKIIMTGLWTEGCLSFPTLDALHEGYEVYPVVDAIGGTSPLVHDTALRRMEQAGAQLTTLVQLACELQRDWAREDTAQYMINILRETGVFPKLD